MSARPEPAQFAGALRYEDTDIPVGMTLAEWRRSRAAERRRRGRRSWWPPRRRRRR